MKKLFEHSMLMSGGGSRFGYYLGIYAASVELNQQPDVIFSSCGGAISAGIIGAFNSIEDQKEALLSYDIYHMITRYKTRQHQSLLRTLVGASSRYFSRRASTVFPDLHHHALFDIENASQPLFPFTPKYQTNALNIAVIGSKLCFNADDIGKKRKSAPLFEEVIFSHSSLLDTLPDVSFIPHSTLIKGTLKKEHTISFQDAIRVSISDIYYLPPHTIDGENFMGGMLDLVPFHLAEYCSSRLSLESKQPFSNFSAVPAFLHLLGYNPNDVQKAIPHRPQDIWIDTTDSPAVLKEHQINKKIKWLSNKITLDTINYDQFREMMQAQWNYGYHKALHAFSQT